MKKAVLLFSVSLLVSCSDSTGPEQEGFSVIPPETPQPAGTRLFGINPSESEQGFMPSWELAAEAGVQVVEILIHWDQVETEEGIYTDPDGVLQAISFYGMENVRVLLTIAVLNTTESTVPRYLSGYDYNSPEVVESFIEMSDWVFQQISPSVIIAGFSIGNEIDIYLEGSQQWNSYTEFFSQVSDHARNERPSIPVEVKCTASNCINGIDSAEIININHYSDVVMMNCYFNSSSFQVLPPESVHEYFEQLVSLFPSKDIWITETGYQSGSEHCGSSQVNQAQFYHELFTAWDTHSDRIDMVLVNWLHDQSPETIAQWIEYYGSSDPGFVEFLSTLGLRNHNHTDKYAWLQVLEEASARGW